jgi:hypothetical protein
MESLPAIRHPEVRANSASKEAAEARPKSGHPMSDFLHCPSRQQRLLPSPFEVRFAHVAG